MRIANIAGRPALVEGDGWIDINTASNGRFSPSMTEAYACWDELRSWADAYTISSPEPLDKADVQAPVPHPRQVFAIGLNFHDHAAETALAVPDSPMVFTKFPSCVTGPSGMIELPGPTVDWEVELIVIIGRETSHVTVGQSWGCVAGVTVGQDLSERTLQMRPPTPQFSLGKSFPGFGPIGPVVVTPDELADPDDVVLSASLNGEIVQKGKTSDLIFSVSELIAYLSSVVKLLPGDLIFTGTPPGVGYSRSPARFLRASDELVSHAEGIGAMRHRFTDRIPVNETPQDLRSCR